MVTALTPLVVVGAVVGSVVGPVVETRVVVAADAIDDWPSDVFGVVEADRIVVVVALCATQRSLAPTLEHISEVPLTEAVRFN